MMRRGRLAIRWPSRRRHTTANGGPRRGRRVTVPSVLQMDAVECGAASLAMILAYHGRFVPLEELRVLCGVSRDGSKATNILRAAHSYHLDAHAFKREPGHLKSMRPPMIVHWSFDHFLVVEGFGRSKVFLNDPATGPRTVTDAEFDRGFTGVVLTFEPGAAFERAGHGRGLLSALSARLVGAGFALAYIVIAGLLLAVPGLVVPAFLRVFVDEVLVKGLIGWMGPLVIAMLATAAASGALTALQQHYLVRLEMKFALSNSSKFFWHLLRLPISFFVQRYPGEIGTRVAINDRIAHLLSGEFASTALSACTVTFYLALMLRYDAALTAVAVTTTLLNVAVVKYSARLRITLSRRLLQDQGKLVATAMGGLQSIETLKSMGMESDFFGRWSGYQAKVLDVQQQLRLQTEVIAAVPPFLSAVSTILILGIGGSRVMDGLMTIGTLVAFQALVAAFTAPVQRLVDIGNTLHEIEGQLDRLDDVMRTGTDERAVVASEPGPKLSGEVALRNLAFGYDPLDPPIVQDFDLNLPSGSRVALVGASGSGKSTIARLVCGLHRPRTGEILFDGKPRNTLSHQQMSHSVAFVDQNIFLFEGTIRDNLTLWDDTISEVDVIRAATDACIHDEIMLRPHGYAARVEEGGRNFSGGQRQRLEIARALVGNPTMIVLDEATSALDPVTEKAVDDNLRRRGCTCLLIAHRLSTIRDCDEIVVLSRGRVVQRGTHSAMKDGAGPYANLIALEAN